MNFRCRLICAGILMTGLFAGILPGTACAQETASDTASVDTSSWEFGGLGAINVSQAAFRNWAAGGENSIALNGLLNLSALYESERFRFQSILDGSVGLTRQGEEDFQKNEDRLDIFAKMGYRFNKKLFLTLQTNLRTQFIRGFNLPNDSLVTSRFFAPAFVNLSLGVDYHPVKWLSVYAAPAAGKFTVVLDQAIADSGRYGVEQAVLENGLRVSGTGQNVRPEFGAMLSAMINKQWESVKVQIRMDLFNNYTNPDRSKRDNVDVNVEGLVSFTFNEFLSVNLTAVAIYDDDIEIPVYEERNGQEVEVDRRPMLQLKQALGVGLTYSFGAGKREGKFKLRPE